MEEFLHSHHQSNSVNFLCQKCPYSKVNFSDEVFFVHCLTKLDCSLFWYIRESALISYQISSCQISCLRSRITVFTFSMLKFCQVTVICTMGIK
ncbi:hypothetical protein XELAEV_18031226mg [Xenopus laevis]|uniref:Uncharacterized protein n=1 Tax=Xenopus laevis TaxID=8355 RepID=A0A974HFJ6_XENLA|nr:hypothetical protein XELAEV_18031226mg [Xenopus laevis]